MILTKDQLLQIDSLCISEELREWDDARLAAYCDELVEFVEKYPDNEVALNKVILAGDKKTVAGLLAMLGASLAKIRADGLAAECGRVAGTIDSIPDDKLEAAVSACVSLAASLSVDIQMEWNRSEIDRDKPKTRVLPVIHGEGEQKIILAVDDIPVSLNYLKYALEDTEYKFDGVTSGAAALEYIAKFTPDLFIIDIEMPNMNGFELAGKIREAGHIAPILFLTGNTARDYLLKAVEAGAVDFIVKPVSVDRIVAKIRKYIA